MGLRRSGWRRCSEFAAQAPLDEATILTTATIAPSPLPAPVCTTHPEARQRATPSHSPPASRQAAAAKWVGAQGVPPEDASKYVGALFHCMSYDSAVATEHTFDEWAAECVAPAKHKRAVKRSALPLHVLRLGCGH